MNNDLYNVLLHLHSIGRWIVLILLLIAIFNSAVAANRPFIKSDNRTGLLVTIFADLMLLIGIALWFMSPRWGYTTIQARGMGDVMSDATARFYVIEHLTGMLIAIILLHIGKAQAKKPIGDKAKHRRTV
ncbi:MAG: hypothetical protein ACO1NX_02465, partial [Chitinophagaceae bacterium]